MAIWTSQRLRDAIGSAGAIVVTVPWGFANPPVSGAAGGGSGTATVTIATNVSTAINQELADLLDRFVREGAAVVT